MLKEEEAQVASGYLERGHICAGPKRPVRESRPPERFCSYMAMATSILDSEPSSYEEAASQQVWREAMQKEYSSIMKNDVLEVVPRPESKSVVTLNGFAR